MKRRIVITKAGRGGYGNEYLATAFEGRTPVHKEVIFGNDIRYANRMFTAEFDKAPIVRRYGKRRK